MGLVFGNEQDQNVDEQFDFGNVDFIDFADYLVKFSDFRSVITADEKTHNCCYYLRVK